MLILGIESSCDETAVSVVENGRIVRSSLIASQVDAHARYGGVVPEVAAREHLKSIDPLTRQALSEANVSGKDIGMVCVTAGPGLIGPLLVGVSYARGLAVSLGCPLVPVDHVHAHVHGALLGLPPEESIDSLFPAIAIVASGGHSNIYFMQDKLTFKLLGYTLDDACGESFDKVAKILGLGYPGGPIIEKCARAGRADAVPMPSLMVAKSDYLLSYSGLKTHMANLARQHLARENSDEQKLADICASFQEVALGQLVRKLALAASNHPQCKSIIVAGGVSANERFRTMLTSSVKQRCLFPPLKYCGDNAAMIAAYGYHLFAAKKSADYSAEANWEAYSRYQFEAVQ